MSLLKPAVVYGVSLASCFGVGFYVSNKQEELLQIIDNDDRFTRKQRRQSRNLCRLNNTLIAILLGSLTAGLTYASIPDDFWDYYNSLEN